MKIRTLLGVVATFLVALTGIAQTVDTVLKEGLYEPYGVVVDVSTTNNYYYITDSVHDRVVRLAPATGEIALMADFATGTIPQGIALARGGLVVANTGSNTLYEISFSGVVTPIAAKDGAGADVAFNGPVGLTADPAGNLYITELGRTVISKLSPANVVSAYASGFKRPTGMAWDAQTSRLFVADTGNSVVKVIEADQSVTIIASLFNGPRGLVWVGGDTGLLVTDTLNHTIDRVFHPFPGQPGWQTTIYAGTGLLGSADGDLKSASFFEPVGLAVDGEGAIVIADLKNDSIRRIRRPVTALPVLNPPGGRFSNDVEVAVSSLSTNAFFYYSTNGMDPVPFTTAFSLPFPAGKLKLENGGPVGLKVRAFSPDLGASQVLSNNFAFFVSALTNSVPGGFYTNDVSLRLSTLTTGATIRYTEDGVAPTETTGTVWAPAQQIYGRTKVFKAKAFRSGYEDSAELSLDFTFQVASPIITPPGQAGTVPILNAATDVMLYSGTDNVEFYWTVSKGADIPSQSSTNHAVSGANNSATFQLDRSGILQVKAFKAGYRESALVSATFNFVVKDPVIQFSATKSDNTVDVWFTPPTDTNIVIYWTTGALEPVRQNTKGNVGPVYEDDTDTFVGTKYTGSATNPIVLAADGTFKARAFRKGFADSALVSHDFELQVAKPTISPDGALTNNAVSVTLSTTTAGADLYYTTDGKDPTANSTKYTVPFNVINSTLKVIGIRAGFADSEIATAVFGLAVAPLQVTDSQTSTNSLDITVKTATDLATLYYTLDGSVPSANNGTKVTSSTFALTFTNNATFKVIGVRDGFVSSDVVTRDYFIKLAAPGIFQEGKLGVPLTNGYFPTGITIVLVNNAPNHGANIIYFTVDGTDPTTNSIKYVAPFTVNALTAPGADLNKLRVRAIAPGTLPSDVVTAQPTSESTVGVPDDLKAGIGSTVVIPITVNLKSGEKLQSLQFKVVAGPTATSIPALITSIQPLSAGTNDFVPLAGTATGTEPTTFSFAGYTAVGSNGVTNQVLDIEFLGAQANFKVEAFATVAMLAVSIPPTAKEGDTYTIQVSNPSGTSDGLQQTVDLKPLAARTITVANISYTVGDSSPGSWYNAGTFGDGNLDNADVNNAFNASLGVLVPYSFSDAFDAMDTFPEDTAASVGGDGQIRFLDWQRILRRSLRRDTVNWERHWTTGGVRVAGTTNLVVSALTPATSFDNTVSGQVWPDAELSAVNLGGAQPGQRVSLPVSVNLLNGGSLAGLQFRAVVQPQDGAPAVVQAVEFAPAAGLPQPLTVKNLPANQVGTAWSPLVNPFTEALTKRRQVGTISFTVPAGAQTGQSYALTFEHPDGVPDLNTQYDFAANRGSVTVGGPARPPAAVASVRGFKLRWHGVTGQRFIVESATDLASNSWTVEADNLAGRGAAVEYVDQKTSSTTKFYRIRTKP